MPVIFQNLDVSDASVILVRVPMSAFATEDSRQAVNQMGNSLKDSISQLCGHDVGVVVVAEGVEIEKLTEHQLRAFNLKKLAR